MEMRTRLLQQAIGDQVTIGPDSDPAKQDYPSLWEWLTSIDAGPTHVKDPGKMTVKATPGGWLVCLTDEAFGVTIDVPCDRLDGILEALEKALSDSRTAIRYWPNHKAKLRPRAKQGPAKA